MADETRKLDGGSCGTPSSGHSSRELRDRLERGYRNVKSALLAERNARGHWEGELSASALSTATAVMALEMVRRGKFSQITADGSCGATPFLMGGELQSLIERGVAWIAAHQNADGGWGDTTRSFSNISTTMLCHAALHATGSAARHSSIVDQAKSYIDRAGGIPALRARYGNDKTFSIPILTQCALAGHVNWSDVSALPFELACVPARFYKWLRLPVVSYALPALIAIGQVRHHFLKPRNPLALLVRRLAIRRSLAILQKIQPASGGFLEAAPLTSFVTMSLAGMGLYDNPVARGGVDFLVRSVRPDGSWPIDTNLATWVTTLSINALGSDLPPDAIGPLPDWLLGQQYVERHPYTNADPGGWAWTDLPGGVPDADDTPGAVLAIINLEKLASRSNSSPVSAKLPDCDAALDWAIGWLIDIQNSDGGWPTFCRGWGALPFDRSAPDLTAHAIRALSAWQNRNRERTAPDRSPIRSALRSAQKAIDAGFAYLARSQRADGSWLPLWFGNQHATDDENPTYGTARVLAAYRDQGRAADPCCRRGVEWLAGAQNSDGGWGGATGVVSSIEETALALEVLASLEAADGALPSQMTMNGICWLLNQIDKGKLMEPSPIGFYFAKLWYFEKLYPLIFTAAALRRAVELFGGDSGDETARGTN